MCYGHIEYQVNPDFTGILLRVELAFPLEELEKSRMVAIFPSCM
jgi:hypothetical protein